MTHTQEIANISSVLNAAGITTGDCFEAPAVLQDSAEPIERQLTWLSHMAILQITGARRKEFLQGYITSDVDTLATDNAGRHSAQRSAIPDIKGRVIGEGLLFDDGEQLVLRTHVSVADAVQTHLNKYAPFTRTGVSVAALTGIGSVEIRSQAGTDISLDASEAAWAVDQRVPATAQPGTAYELNYVAARYSLPGNEPSFVQFKERWLPFEAALAELRSENTSQRLASLPQWLGLNIAAYSPAISAATSARLLPQACGLVGAGAVSFEKGCYLGQEIVARATHRGQVKKTLSRLYCPASALAKLLKHTGIPAGTAICTDNDRKVGEVLYSGTTLSTAAASAPLETAGEQRWETLASVATEDPRQPLFALLPDQKKIPFAADENGLYLTTSP